jgi:apoptosis-inducing factor 3
MREFRAGKTSDLQDGEMKTIDVDQENKILLCRIKDAYFALSPTCPHYGAPLEEGILNNERIVCPWHQSCFHAKTGDMLEPPSIQSLVKYETKISGDDIIIMLPEELETARVPEMTKSDKETLDEVLIIGAGASGYMAAQSLRENGYTGKIRMLTSEEKTPYDRPNLSKDYLAGSAEDEWMPLRNDAFYDEYGIEVIFNKTVKELYIEKNLLIFDDGMQLNFSKLIIASGGIPRKFELPGSELNNIYYLRSWQSSDEIIKASESADDIVIVGGSFIGMEAAFHLKKRTGKNITVIIKEDLPFVKTFGPEIGRLFLEHHKENGIIFRLNKSVSAFEGDQKVNSIILDDGDKIKTDLVLAGIGVKPAVSFIKDIDPEKDGSIKVDDRFCLTGDVYAIGDISTFPYWKTGGYTRIEHWRTALQQGKTAALNIMGKNLPYRGIPFFWTRHGDLGLVYVGHARDWDEIIFSSYPGSKEFIAYYIKDNSVIAAAGINKNKDMAIIHELLSEDKMPQPEKLRKRGIDISLYL